LFFFGKLLKNTLQRFQSRAARVLTGINYDIRSAELLETLSWDTLDIIDAVLPSQYYSTKYLMTTPRLALEVRNSFARREVHGSDKLESLKSPGQPQCNARFCLRFSVTFLNCCRHSVRGHKNGCLKSPGNEVGWAASGP
jgi:hypothetical protein